MTLNEFRRHPAYDYYIRTLVSKVVVFEKGGFVGNLGLSKKLLNKYVEVWRKYKTDTDKMTASDYTHLFGYLNPYYRSAYNVSKHRK